MRCDSSLGWAGITFTGTNSIRHPSPEDRQSDAVPDDVHVDDLMWLDRDLQHPNNLRAQTRQHVHYQAIELGLIPSMSQTYELDTRLFRATFTIAISTACDHEKSCLMKLISAAAAADELRLLPLRGHRAESLSITLPVKDYWFLTLTEKSTVNSMERERVGPQASTKVTIKINGK